MNTTLAQLRRTQQQKNSRLCIGLDPDPTKMPSHLLNDDTAPAEAVVQFTRAIIDATADLACAYKLNLAFYEALRADGWDALAQTIGHIPDDVLVIADGKRGDIGNTANFYADAIFDGLGCGACTVAPYMGQESVLPFLRHPGRGAFVLARTSNAGADAFQNCLCEGEPLYLTVARKVAEWEMGQSGWAGLVAGATDLDALEALRGVCPTLPFLIPGVGAQGGDPEQVVRVAATDDGLIIVNSSRSILYASSGTDFADAARAAAASLRAKLAG